MTDTIDAILPDLRTVGERLQAMSLGTRPSVPPAMFSAVIGGGGRSAQPHRCSNDRCGKDHQRLGGRRRPRSGRRGGPFASGIARLRRRPFGPIAG